MDTQDLQKQIDDLSKRTDFLERISIQLDVDPTTAIYLQQAVTPLVAAILLTYPTQTYSNSSPSGTAPTGSVWFYDTGVLATRAVYVYNSGWIQFK